MFSPPHVYLVLQGECIDLENILMGASGFTIFFWSSGHIKVFNKILGVAQQHQMTNVAYKIEKLPMQHQILCY